MKQATDSRVTPERFGELAGYAASLKECLKGVEEELAGFPRPKFGNNPIVEGIEEAFRYQGLRDEEGRIKEELKELNRELKEGGMPEMVWVMHRRTGGAPAARIKLAAGDTALEVEFV